MKRKDKMTAKETIETIDNLSDADWQRMKEHMDKKFPNMKLPSMKSFQTLVRMFSRYEEYKEKLN